MKVTDGDAELIVKWCDGNPFPGIIQDVDHDSVEAMHNVGKNIYFWPLCEDGIWFKFVKLCKNVISLTNEPKNETKRHVEIDCALWQETVKSLDIN